MKALILNSGIGSRMEELTKNSPKCLVPVGGKNILGRQLELLTKSGITDVVITTGPFETQIIDFVFKNFPSLRASYINNTTYASTNYIYSIFLAKRVIDNDLLLLHGDLVFEESALKAVLDSKNGVIINDKAEVPFKDFKGRIRGGIVTEIGVNVFGENCFMLQPLYMLPKDKFTIWLKEIETCVKNGDVKSYAENAFNKVSHEINLKPVYYRGFCMEIDNKTDLSIAENFFSSYERQAPSNNQGL